MRVCECWASDFYVNTLDDVVHEKYRTVTEKKKKKVGHGTLQHIIFRGKFTSVSIYFFASEHYEFLNVTTFITDFKFD